MVDKCLLENVLDSRSYLKALVETTYPVLRMLEKIVIPGLKDLMEMFRLRLKTFHFLITELSKIWWKPISENVVEVLNSRIYPRKLVETTGVHLRMLKKFLIQKITSETVILLYSRAYLKDLVETTHLFLRMLEKFTKTNNHLIVQGRQRKRKKKAKKGISERFLLCICVSPPSPQCLKKIQAQVLEWIPHKPM